MKKTLGLLAVGLSVLFLAPLVLAAEETLSDGMSGFRGMLWGTIVSKTENSLVLKVEKIGETWKLNKATNPQAAVGKELTLTIAAERERLIKALAERKVGDAIVVGAMNTEGNVLSGVEVLKLATEEAPAPTAEEVAKLKARIAELEKQVAALKAENEALRKQLAEAKAVR